MHINAQYTIVHHQDCQDHQHLATEISLDSQMPSGKPT